MSSGQKAWAEELEEEALREHMERLRWIGFGGIAGAVDDVVRHLRAFEKSGPSLTREQWAMITALSETLERLK